MKEELDKLQGIWNVVALEVEGQKMGTAATTGARIVVNGNRFTTASMGATYDGVLDVDPVPNPKTFNLSFTDGPEKGNTSLGIYELDGDTWKICLTLHGNRRPTAFATKPGSGHALETLKREHGDTARSDSSASPEIQNLSALSFEPVPELQGEWSMESCTRDGHPLEKSLVACGKRITKGDETTTSFGGQVFMQAKISVDRAKDPKAIDYVHTQGPNEGKVQLGIYELNGETLKTSMSTPGQDRPVDFTTGPGDGRTVSVWRLRKK
jgi:uncharacterized protein (TIGR03067 family)